MSSKKIGVFEFDMNTPFRIFIPINLYLFLLYFPLDLPTFLFDLFLREYNIGDMSFIQNIIRFLILIKFVEPKEVEKICLISLFILSNLALEILNPLILLKELMISVFQFLIVLIKG